jgi:hypothetical protein
MYRRCKFVLGMIVWLVLITWVFRRPTRGHKQSLLSAQLDRHMPIIAILVNIGLSCAGVVQLKLIRPSSLIRHYPRH